MLGWSVGASGAWPRYFAGWSGVMFDAIPQAGTYRPWRGAPSWAFDYEDGGGAFMANLRSAE